MKLNAIFLPQFKRYPLIAALLAQVMSLFFIKLGIQFFHFNLSPLLFIFSQSILSALITQLIFKLPKWFLIISLLFPILVFLGFNYFHIGSGVYGILFVFFALTFSHTLRERVPLYLSNPITHKALQNIVLDREAKNFLDLGSGLGGVVRALASSNINSVGVESAPLLWFVSCLISRISSKGAILRQNIWQTNLDQYEVVYAFLSPAIMDKLFKKVKAEMKPGSLFISNSFDVTGVKPDKVEQLNDTRETILYFYFIK